MELFDWIDELDKEEEKESFIKKEDVSIAGDLFKDERPLSVSELSDIVKTMVQGVGKVIVQGEISNLSKPASGHIYFKLKDSKNTINAVVWKSAVKKLKFQPEEGLEVTLTGKMTIFSARSEYQINVSNLEPAGLGSLMKLFNERKEKFEKEGLFDQSLKKEINKFPETIAVVTSKTGDVFYDILHRIEQRFPCKIFLYPVKVQGENADEEVKNALQNLNDLSEKENIDTIILARGGGSVEDLWTFNEEKVVRAVFDSKIPIISAIGHEPDFTLVDYVSDLRAPTPTGAAELATEDSYSVKQILKDKKFWLNRSFIEYFHSLEQRLDYTKLKLLDLTRSIDEYSSKFNYLEKRIKESFGVYIASLESTLREKKSVLNSLSVDSVLQRGFVFIRDEKGNIIKSKKTEEKNIEIKFKDGVRKAKLKDD